jgi:hypothetical protein
MHLRASYMAYSEWLPARLNPWPRGPVSPRWHDTGARIKLLFGGVGHVLNVTSQQWLDTSRAATARDPQNGGPTDIWSHQVVVLVPNVVKHRNVSMAYLTGSCNNKPSVPKVAMPGP